MASASQSITNAKRVGLMPDPAWSVASLARRQHRRFPIAVDAVYILAGIRAAMTRNISSGGVFLNTPVILPVGRTIHVLIEWPMLLDHHTHLRLVVSGKVLRSDAVGTAVEIAPYEFRVRAHNGLAH